MDVPAQVMRCRSLRLKPGKTQKHVYDELKSLPLSFWEFVCEIGLVTLVLDMLCQIVFTNHCATNKSANMM